MDAQLVKRLLALNHEFYAEFAKEFSATRSVRRFDLKPMLPYLRDGVKVLDAGCGNGRLAERLEHEGFALAYIGIDAAPELIETAEKRRTSLRRVSAVFHVADITTPRWTTPLETSAPFDVVFALAVVHHIPGAELRRQVLLDFHSLMRPGGVLVMSNWQFMQNERLRRKVVPWRTLGIDESKVEPGDALLDWKRGGAGCRYVHQLTPSEVQSLSDETGFQVLEQFHADADMNLYSVLKRKE